MSQQIPQRFSGGAVDLSHLAARSAAGPQQSGPGASPERGQTVDVPSLVLEVTDQSFEQAAQLSAVVPVIVYLRADESPECQSLDPLLERLVLEAAGGMLLARVDAMANPGLVQAFQVQGVPAAIALLAGRPVPLFQGAAAEPQLRDLFGQLMQLAAQQGVIGRVSAPETEGEQGEAPVEPPVNPAHAEALEALERGDYAAAAQAYEQVLLKAPAEHEAKAALAQVSLLDRLQGAGIDEIRSDAAANPDDIDAQLRVADLDLSGGHIEDAFLRLLDLFAASVEAEDRTRIRERLLELFEVVGQGDPRVAAARARLANLLY